MNLRRGLIGLAGLLLVGGWWEVAAANQGLLEGPRLAVRSPLKPAPERMMTPQGMIRPEAMPLEVDPGMLGQLQRTVPGQSIQLNSVLLEPGFSVNLEVTRVEPFAPGAQVVLMENDGKGGVREKKVDIPNQVILAGQVVGEPESRVVLGLAQAGCNGFISTESGLYLVASPADMDGPPVIYPVGDRAGAIDVMPKLFPVGVKDPGPELEPPAPLKLDPAIGSKRIDDTRSNRAACTSSKCCIEDPESDYNIYGQPDDWTCIDALDETECWDFGGIWDDNTSWSSANCNATYSTHITGACCLRSLDSDPSTSMCVLRTLQDCEALNGLFAGRGTQCFTEMCRSYGLECFHATLGIDTDDEFLLVFDGNTSRAINYIALLVGASSQIFDDNIRLKFKIRAIRLWAAGTDPWPQYDDFEVDFEDLHDPYTSGTEDTIIQEMHDRWIADPPPGAAPLGSLNAIHMLSGQSLGYGYVSQLGGLCLPDDVVCGITSGIHGSFPYPIFDFHPDNWDLMFFTQVMGRMAGARYTHQYTEDPVQHRVFIDRCGSLYEASPCIFPENFPPSLMSFCYRCPGGVSNLSMQFHPYVRGEMFKRILQSPCIFDDYPNVMAVDDIGFTVPGLPVRLDVLANDRVYECRPITASLVPDDFLDIDTRTASSEPLEDYPRQTPLGGFLTTTPDPGNNPNQERNRELLYIPPCDLFELWECPSGNPLQNYPDNINSTTFENNYPVWSHYIDSFAYRANMNSSLGLDPSQAGRNDNATVRVVVSPPPMNWPSACLEGIEWKPGSPNTIENRIVFDLGMDVAINPDSSPRVPYDVRVLSVGFLNLNNNTTIANTNVTNPEGICFELYVNDDLVQFTIAGSTYSQLCPWDPSQDFYPDFLNGNCSAFVFDDLRSFSPDPLNTNGDIRVEVTWTNNLAFPPPAPTEESIWFDGRVYVQIDDTFGACCLSSLDPDCLTCECMSQSACLEQGGSFLGRGSACPGPDPWDPPQQACTLISYYGACEVGSSSNPATYQCTCTTEIDCFNLGGTFLGAGEPCPEYQGIPKGPDCLTFDRGACCLLGQCYPSINNPTLEYLTSAECELWGGVFRGSGTTCFENFDSDGTAFPDQDICSTDPPLALGACCIPQTNLEIDCLCGITTSAVCLNQRGIWQEYWDAPNLGSNSHCFAQTCNGEYHPAMCFNDNATHEGACCLSTSAFPDGGCLVTDRVTCWALNGNFVGYQGDGIPCGEGLCDVGSGQGACCLASGACINRTEEECEALPGNTTFYPGQVCIGAQCPPDPSTILGACCLGPGGYCLDNRSQQDCLALQGEFQGDNSTCATTTCIDGSQGACCVQINFGGETYYNCIQPYNVADCLSQGGTWLDDGQRCVDNPCGLEGVCCFDEVCYPTIDTDPSQTNEQECQAIGGTWTPGDVPCESGICVTRRGPPLRVGCDVNLDGVEDISDFLMIIQNYGQRGDRGDFNRDGIVTVDDILDYLDGCP